MLSFILKIYHYFKSVFGFFYSLNLFTCCHDILSKFKILNTKLNYHYEVWNINQWLQLF